MVKTNNTFVRSATVKEHLQRLEEGLAKEETRIPIKDLLTVNGGGRGGNERQNTPVEVKSTIKKTNSKLSA